MRLKLFATLDFFKFCLADSGLFLFGFDPAVLQVLPLLGHQFEEFESFLVGIVVLTPELARF